MFNIANARNLKLIKPWKTKPSILREMWTVVVSACFAFFLMTFNQERNASAAERGDVGIGVMLGQPLGPTLKWWTASNEAIKVGVGINDDLAAYVDYLWHNWNFFPVPDQGELAAYLALGGRVEDDDDAEVGIRTMGGASYFFPAHPIEVFLEVGPVIEISPEVDVDLDAGLGFHFYFR